uniref:BTB domain-containing protein n=1 Tax=Panagrolaimus sp. PS1159 TaxID=55785 RepID=A0AC35F1M9_9BILA
MSMLPKIKVQCPIAIMWTISEHRLAELKDKPGRCLASDRFEASNIPGVQYSIKIYPNDDEKERREQTWIYLHLKYSDEIKIKANFRITIESANTTKKLCHKFEKSKARGRKFCTTEELFDPENRFIVNGQMMIKMDGVLTIDKEAPPEIVTIEDDSDDLSLGLWNQEEDKDFTIVADGKEFAAHKLVLSTRSSVFARMFKSGMKEAKENKVEIEDFSYAIVEMGVKLCYHHSLVPRTNLEEKMKLLQFFDKYDMQQLKDNYESQLIREIDESNVCILANISLLSNCTKLKERCADFIRDCMKTKPIKDLDSLDTDFAMKMFKNAFYHVSK